MKLEEPKLEVKADNAGFSTLKHGSFNEAPAGSRRLRQAWSRFSTLKHGSFNEAFYDPYWRSTHHSAFQYPQTRVV